MKGLVLFFLLWFPQLALAQTVIVKSGDHEGFTRLVMELPRPMEWRFGRTADGYEVLLQQTGLRYDVSDVFRLIGRTRLAAIWPDPETGVLRLGVACACHAVPFEFRPGILVVDIRTGPPPEGSSFELSLAGPALPGLSERPPSRPRARPDAPIRADAPVVDWRNLALDAASFFPADPQRKPSALAFPNPALGPLREALVEQMARGAAQGVVDLAMPKPAGRSQEVPDVPNARIALGGLPGMAVGADRPKAGMLTNGGDHCIPDDALDIGKWKDDRPVAEQIAEARAGLTGEFDLADPAAVLRSMRFLISIGYGAEARQLNRAFPLSVDAKGDAATTRERRILDAMGQIVDGDAARDNIFKDMAACDTAAAVWAILADTTLPTSDSTNDAAVRRTFSALPPELRQLLGPRLVGRFQSQGGMETVRALTEAIQRSPGDHGPETVLMRAGTDLSVGAPEKAEIKLEPLIEHSGPGTADALLVQVQARLDQSLPVSADVVPALEAIAQENRGTPREKQILALLVLAVAATGDFDGALMRVEKSPEVNEDLWKMLAEKASDDAMLRAAVRQVDDALPIEAVATRRKLAQRLIGLGLGKTALYWLGAPPIDIELAARATLQAHDARSTLRLLAGTSDPMATDLRIRALEQLGDATTAAAARGLIGDQAGQARTLTWTEAWPTVAATGPEEWRAVARLADAGTAAVSPLGPLAQSRNLLDRSSETRREIKALLDAVSVPRN